MSKSFSFDVLSDGSLILTLGEACIQTTARRAYRELTLALLEGQTEGAALEPLVDTLERFLSNTNFAALRSDHPALAGGTRCRVRLCRQEEGVVGWEIVWSR